MMLSTLVFLLLLDLATSIQFLEPSSGRDFATNESILIKWKKVAGASNYSISWNTSDGCSFDAFKVPTRCNPRYSIGLLHQEGDWGVLVEARNQNGDAIDSGSITVRVCQSPHCPNASETERACPIGQILGYYTSPGYKIQDATPNYTFTVDNEQACVDACTWIARSTPCKSVDFNNVTNACDIYSMETFPQGNATVSNDSVVDHYEKVCINATFGCRCRGPYFIGPQHMMISTSAVLYYTTVNDINTCFQQCVDDAACLSGHFYPDLTERNCEMKSESFSTNPGAYTPIVGFNVTYFEPGCTK